MAASRARWLITASRTGRGGKAEPALFPDQALRTAQENAEDARAIDHALSLCYALEAACLVPLWMGDLSAAERSVAMLLDHSARHALTVWHARGRCLNGVLLIKRGDSLPDHHLVEPEVGADAVLEQGDRTDGDDEARTDLGHRRDPSPPAGLGGALLQEPERGAGQDEAEGRQGVHGDAARKEARELG